jgi:hypothetical protein
MGPLAIGSALAGSPSLEEIRAATEKYQDVNAALADGFVAPPDNACVSAAAEGLPAEWGAMGIHYMHPERLGVTAMEPRVNGNGMNQDFLQPSILVYEPGENGELTLVAVENLIFEKAWQEAGNGGPPMLGDIPWDRMVDDPNTPLDEAHGFEPHYDLHAWVGRKNPAGDFKPFNTAVKCPS